MVDVNHLSIAATMGILLSAGSALGASSADSVQQQEQSLAGKVVKRTHIKGFDLRRVTPFIRIDAGPQLSRYDGVEKNTVHEELWSRLPLAEQAQFNRWAKASTEPDGEHLYNDMFHRFFSCSRAWSLDDRSGVGPSIRCRSRRGPTQCRPKSMGI